VKAAAHIKTPAQYLTSLPEERREPLTTLHKAIRKAAPKLQPHICYGMLGYGTYPYRYADGREAVGPVIALASQKQHISLYMGCEGDGGLSKTDQKRLGKVSVGKCCIRFKKLADIDLAFAMELVKRSAVQYSQ